MAATNRFLGLNPGHLRVGKVREAATSTTTDDIELRLLTIRADGTTHTNLTRASVIKALEIFKNYLIMGGYIEFNNQSSGGLPLPAGDPPQVG